MCLLLDKFKNIYEFIYLFIFLNKTCKKVQNRKHEHHHSIFGIQISQNTKFHFKLTILFIWTKFAPKQKKVNIIIEFFI